MKRQYKWLIAASAATLTIALTLGLGQLLLPKKAAVELKAGQTIQLTEGNLVIHAITRSSGKIGMPPDADNVELAFSDLPAIFGRAPIPELPLALKPESETISALMFRSGTVFMMSGITYGIGDPAGPRVVFDLNDQGELPLTDCLFVSEEASVWNGIDLMMGVGEFETETGFVEQYVARFVVHDIGYQVQATGLTGEQFLDVLSALIDG